MGKWDALVKGALLHDIGKVVYRANQGTDAHSKRGAAFIEPYFSDMGLKQSITHCLNGGRHGDRSFVRGLTVTDTGQHIRDRILHAHLSLLP